MPTFTSSAARTTTAVRLEGRAAASLVVGASRAMVADAKVELKQLEQADVDVERVIPGHVRAFEVAFFGCVTCVSPNS